MTQDAGLVEKLRERRVRGNLAMRDTPQMPEPQRNPGVWGEVPNTAICAIPEVHENPILSTKEAVCGLLDGERLPAVSRDEGKIIMSNLTLIVELNHVSVYC